MIGTVENAMLARLKTAADNGVLGYRYVTYENWPTQFDVYLQKRQARYPACWSAFGGAHKIERVATGSWRVHCAFGLVVAAENLRNESSRRLGGSASEPGSYQLAADALKILGGQALGLDIDALAPTSILPVDARDIPGERQISIYAVSFETAVYYETLRDVTGDLDAFRIFHANWDPAPFGHVDPGALPDDAPAIAADHILEPQ